MGLIVGCQTLDDKVETMRPKRENEPNRCYHLISRIAHRSFFLDEEERDRFVSLIRRVEQFSGVVVLGYGVMTNHFHIYIYMPEAHPVSEEELYLKICNLYCKDSLAEILGKWRRLKEEADRLPESVRAKGESDFDKFKRSFLVRMFSVSEMMKTLKEHYTLSYNARHEHVGTLWECRFHSRTSKPLSPDMSSVLAYIDCNPVGADICDYPTDYRWCSFAAAMSGDLEARRGYAFVYGNGAWEEIAAAHRRAIDERIAAIRKEREMPISTSSDCANEEAMSPRPAPPVIGKGKVEVARRVMDALKGGERKPTELLATLGLKCRAFFNNAYLKPLTDQGYIEMTRPDKPSSPRQSYRLTDKGFAFVA